MMLNGLYCSTIISIFKKGKDEAVASEVEDMGLEPTTTRLRAARSTN
jgi:hypothetical protein